MAPYSSTLAWKIPWTEEPGRLQSMGSQRVRHDWATSLSLFTFMHWRRKWQPTPVFLPGESRERRAWWAAVYGVTQSQARLKWLSSSSMALNLDVPWLQEPLGCRSCSRGSGLEITAQEGPPHLWVMPAYPSVSMSIVASSASPVLTVSSARSGCLRLCSHWTLWFSFIALTTSSY